MDCSCCFAFRVSKRSRPRGGRRLDQSGRLILNLGDLGLVLVDLDLDLGVQVARGGDEEVEGDDLDALAAVVLDDALQGVVPVVARRRKGRKLTRMRSTT